MDHKVTYSATPSPNDAECADNGVIATTPRDEESKSQQPKQNGGRFPPMFDRCSSKWWNPQMDSEVLEKQCGIFSSRKRKSYFKLNLILIMAFCVAWMILFGVARPPTHWIAGIIWFTVLLLISIILFTVVQLTNWFQKFSSYLALAITVPLVATTIAMAYYTGLNGALQVGSFYLLVEIILLVYVYMPLPLHICLMIGLTASISYEVVYHVLKPNSGAGDIVAQVLLLLCCNAIGISQKHALEVRTRCSFWKVGQLITSNLSAEFKKIMIDSIMPKSVSEKLLGQNLFKTSGESTFRPLFVETMNDVSILYADIVGFTKMSANKSAAELVYLLNDLFRRFDTLCLKTGCEKISTLGDCYYCVSGCPDKKEDHARCCVEMGLGMISAIKDFCHENGVNVDMRIGIHTGIVICGIVGMKRFKFDVWSNDVSFANHMEQWGVPGKIHISEETKKCLVELGNEYVIEDGKTEERVPKEVLMKKPFKTFLISRRIDDDSESSTVSDDSSDSENCTDAGKDTNTSVKIFNEKKGKSNGTKSESVSVKRKGGDGDNAANGEGAVENQGSGRGSTHRIHAHENTQPTDPLLSAKRASSRRHHSTRKSRKRLQPEPDIKPVKIYELIGMHGMMPFLDSKVREKQDVEFINSIKDNSRMKGLQEEGLVHPVSLNFQKTETELAYRNKFVTGVIKNQPVNSFSNMRFCFSVNLWISIAVFLSVFIANVASLQPNIHHPAWLVVFLILLIFTFFITVVYFVNYKNAPPVIQRLIFWFTKWTGRHVAGALLFLFPYFLVVSHMYCRQNAPSCDQFLIVICLVLVHFVNFAQLNSWMRSILAVLVIFVTLLLFYVNQCPQTDVTSTSASTTVATTPVDLCDRNFQFEFIMHVVLLLAVIFVVSRTTEEDFRRNHHNADEVETSKNQTVDELLHHIIPPRVTAVIREKKTYSKDHCNVGVVFASITNFNEFYEEQFAGGKECIRILNEVIADVDMLLDRREFHDIEKIKTIGSTFMIAAGLDPNIERDLENHSHLHMLMEFCIAMQETIRVFSESMVAFTFVLRIGFNHGSVTAGVIGTTKLLYDIWGDTVNIASRMDSTGVPGKIQVSEGSMACLKDKYDFEHRGSTFVKGKGQMETYLLNDGPTKKPEDYKPDYNEYR